MERRGAHLESLSRCLRKVSDMFSRGIWASVANFIKDACNFFGRLGVYEDHGGIVLSAEEGKAIARALGKENIACILQNHGCVGRHHFFSLFIRSSG